MTLAPLFIVGTGRCGSTLLSELVRAHPRLLSVSEFFSTATDLGGRIAACFPEHPVEAAELWRLVGGPAPRLGAMLRHDVAMDEVLYRREQSRFSPELGVPAILHVTLPHLTSQPDAIFDELAQLVAALPRGSAGEFYERLFGRLAERFGHDRWVERSGGSLRLIRRLCAAFPGARFVHLVRDGRNCAISMSRHLGFRMALVSMALTEILGVDPWESADRTFESDLSDELAAFLPERFDPAAFLAYSTPLPLCGHYWSGEILAGLAELAEVAPERRLTLRYEDFLAAPRLTIARLFEFLEAPAEAAWLDRAAATVRPARSQWTALPERDRQALHDACGPGFAALGELYAES